MSQFLDDLLQSVKEMDTIVRGDMPHSHCFVVEPPPVNVQAVRETTGLTRASLHRCCR